MFRNIRDKKFLFICIILSLFLTLGACKKLDKEKGYNTLIVDDYNGINFDQINHYKINIDFNPHEKIYTGEQCTTYVNNTDKELNELYFYLYPNAFKSIETVPILFDDMNNVFPDGFEKGYIDLNKLLVDKKECNFSIEGTGETILRIDLKKPLKPKKKVKIYMEYEGKLPPVEDRYGYSGETFNFGNWYPIACVYDEKGWNKDPYYSIGDPFYSDVSNYDVTITAPKDIIVAASGNIVSEKYNKHKKAWNIEGKLLRDFAWVASKNFVIEKRDIDGTLVKIYFLEDESKVNKFACDVVEKCVKTFSKIFGKYPYGHYSVVMNNFSTGMEYPGLVYISKDYCSMTTKEFLETIIVHETAHQWWYGVVGNDQIDEAWLDESLATYSEVIYVHEVYGEELGDNYYDFTVSENYRRSKELFDFDEVVLKSLNEFKDWNDYGALVYSRGAMFLNEIEKNFGKEVLYDILSKYYEKFRFLNATTKDFLEVCEEVTNTSFKGLAEKWLLGKY